MRVVCYTRFTSCLFGEENPADIISQQNQRIKDYARAHGYKLQTRYSDRKQDENADEAFTQMLNDGLARKYDLIIVDSLYRTGKNLWFAKEMFLLTFYPAGIHFVVIEDNFCSLSKSYEEVNAYFEEKVSEYHQETIRRRILDRHRKGILCWNDLKYGYQMTDDYQMVINPETAPVVKRIFDMFLAGKTAYEIADIFRNEKIPTPLTKRGTNVKIDDPYNWTGGGVKRILQNQAYTGHWVKKVQGEFFDLYHEPIVTEEEYKKALAIIEEKSKPTNRQSFKNKYAGYIVEENGINGLRYHESKYGEKYFRTLRSVHKKLDHISLAEMDHAVYQAFLAARDQALHIKEMLEKDGPQELEARLAIHEKQIVDLAYETAALEKERMQSYIDQNLDEEKEAEFKAQLSAVENKISENREAMKTLRKAYSLDNPRLKLYLSLNPQEAEAMNRVIIRKYLGKVIMDVVTIKRIEMLYPEWLSYFPEEWRETNGQEK